jgi:pyrimidine-specific ribonucleoside hydrolase
LKFVAGTRPVIHPVTMPAAGLHIVFDMETRDPDDVLTLCLLATHPDVELAAVCVNPGTPAQVGVVRAVLARAGRNVPIGARNPTSASSAVSDFHGDWLGPTAAATADAVAHELIAATLRDRPDAVLVTGAPLHNLRLWLHQHPEGRLARWVAQGGFAGDNLVPPALRLDKFAGRVACESFNFGGDKKGTQLALASDRIALRQLVSKNVTHGLAWDARLHARIGALLGSAPVGVQLMHEAMGVYLATHPDGKLLHDPLAACAAIDPSIVSWIEVRVTYAAGQWGAEAAAGTGTFISISADAERFVQTLVKPALAGHAPLAS